MENWIKEIPSAGKKTYSQGNQDGIIQYIFKNIGTTNKFCVEFGFNTDTLTGGSGSNVARLVLEDKWKSLLLDRDYQNISINLYKEFLTIENIGEIFNKYSVPKEPDYISIDVDSIDLWLMKSILEKNYRPRLMSVEYNANFPLEYSYTIKPCKFYWTEDMVYGASLLALYTVAKEFDYNLIAIEPTLDLFFVRGDLLKIEAPPIIEFKNSTGIPCPQPRNRPLFEERFEYFVEYPSMNPISVDIIKKLPIRY